LKSSSPNPPTVPAEPKWFVDCFDEAYIDLDVLRHFPDRNRLEVDQLIRRLDIQKHESWLDVCCGYGRHLLPLVARGHEVTGLDLSSAMIRRLRAAAQRNGLTAPVLQCDMRRIPFHDFFHGAFLLGTSFGVFDDPRQDALALDSIRRALRTGGKFLLDQVNPAILLADPAAQKKEIRIKEQWIREEIIPIPERGQYIVQRTLRRGSWERQWRMRFRAYDVAQLTASMLKAGLSPIDLFGSLDGRPFKPESPRIVLLAVRRD